MGHGAKVIPKLIMLLMAATAIAVAPCAAVGQDQKEPLRFLGNKAIAPFISLENGKPAGIVVDLAYALADKAGLTIDVEAMDWSTAQSEVLQGKADALLQINPNPQREQIYDFSDTLLVSDFDIFRKATRTDIQSLESLRGKRVGVESGGFPAQQLGAGGFQLIPVTTWKAAFTLLDTNQIDAVIVDRWVGEYELAVNRFDGIAAVDSPVAQNYSRVAVKKGNKQLLDKINIGLESIKQDGVYRRIMEKWRPKEVMYFTKQSVDAAIFSMLVACGIILIGISVRIVTHARALKKINIKLTHENAARRAAETELAASHRNLEQVVELRTMELRRSEERLRLFIDRAPAAIAMFDREMRYLAVSRRFITDFFPGSGMEPVNSLSHSHYELFPDCPEHWREVHRRVLAGETLSADDEPFPREDGRCDWVRWEMAPWHRTDGSPGGAVLFCEVITPRKHAEVALRESEARFRAAVQAVSGIVWTSNTEGAMAGQQPGWAALTGQSYEDYQANGWAKAIHPDDAQPTIDAWNQAVAEGRPLVFEHRVRRHDGVWRRFSVRAVPVLGQDGTIREWVGVHTDITQQREAEAALAASEARLRDLLETLNLGTLMTAEFETGLIRFWSKGCERLYGWTAAEAIGQAARDLLQSLTAPLPEIRPVLARDDEWTGDVQHVTRDGRELAIGTRALLRRDMAGRPHEILAALTDVTAQRQAEAALAENEARLRLALEAGRMGLWSWDLGADRLQWDARHWELFGMKRSAGQPTIAAALARVHPEDRPGLRAAIEAALTPGAGTLSHEFRVVLPGGAVRWLAGHGHAVPGPDTRAAHMVGLTFDVTERRRMTEVLTREAAQLEHLAERRAQALAETELRLAEAARMEALGRLAGGMAHDFNNVLQAVQGRLALAELAKDLDSVRRHLARAAEAAERGTKVTGRLLTFARRGELCAEPIAPASLLDGLGEILGPTLGADIVLRIEADPDLPTVSADRGQLEAVLVNLANNARDAMPRGGTLVLRAARISAMAERAPPDLTSPGLTPPGLASPGLAPLGLAPLGRSPGDHLRLSIVDDGEGMPPEVLARVTEPFFTTKPKGKGTGLGLAMARGFAEQSGGTLTIESAPGRGTTVSLRLPEATAAAAVPDRDQEAPNASGEVVTPARPVTVLVLVVEDNPDILEIMATALAQSGFAASQAEHAAAALALLDAGLRPHAIVTDLTMPGSLDGLGLVEEARRRLPRLPVVLVTGNAGFVASERLEAAERGGPFALVRKPASPDVLVARLSRVLGQGRSNAAAAA